MVWVQLFLLSLGKASPLLLAGLGGIISELAGVINFALEGMMLMGAFMAVLFTFLSGSPWIGLMGGAIGGMSIGLAHGLACLKFRANQIVSSVALNLLAAGVTGMLLNQVFEVYGTSPGVEKLPSLDRVIQGFGPAILGSLSGWVGRLSVLAPMALLVCLVVMVFFKWNVWGTRIRACGENPLAADAAGLPVFKIRFLVLLASGVLAGMGGAYLSIGELSQFVEQMTHGRGYLAIAALILGRWRFPGVLLAAFFFGFAEALSEWSAVRWPELPYQFFLSLPYLSCLMVLTVYMGKRQPPSALGRL